MDPFKFSQQLCINSSAGKSSHCMMVNRIEKNWAGLFQGQLSKNYSGICFSKQKIRFLIKYCPNFPREKLVNPKFSDQIRLCKFKNKIMG